jgi:hypothetical protein
MTGAEPSRHTNQPWISDACIGKQRREPMTDRGVSRAPVHDASRAIRGRSPVCIELSALMERPHRMIGTFSRSPPATARTIQLP